MYYIVGLGNPGEKYQNTRHNVGWMVLDAFVQEYKLPSPYASRRYAGTVTEGVLYGQEVTLLYPETFMNQSGAAVKKLVPKGAEGNLIVVYDDVDIPLGEIKLSVGRGDGGHNGISSIIQALGTKEFVRVRVGIAPKSLFGKTKRPKGSRLPKHVLSNFKKSEYLALTRGIDRAVQSLACVLHEGVVSAMNRYNK